MNDVQMKKQTTANAPGAHAVQPAVDVFEGEGDFLVLVDLPGVSEKDLDVTLDKSELSLQARAAVGASQVEYRRRFSLPSLVDYDRLDASLSAGVLTLRLPKRPDAKPRKIAIAAA